MKNMITNASKKSILMMSLLASMVVLISCGGDGDSTPGPDPDPDPATVNAGFTSEVDLENSFTYTFTNNTVIFGIDDLTGTFAWDFGGDGTSTEKNPTYTFSTAGEFLVTLTATAADGTEGTASETITVTAPKNKWASITDLLDTDTGELRVDLADSIRTGRVTFNFMKETDSKDGFISLCGNSTTGDFMIAEVRLKNAGSSHEWREGAPSDAPTNFPDPKDNEWVAVEMSWSANGTDVPTFSLTIDGVSVGTNLVSTTNGGDVDVPGHLEATKDGLHTIQWKYNSNSAIDDKTYSVDDIVVYSSDSGSEVVVFSDDFQGYQTGTNLNPGEDPLAPTTPYHINTVDASVSEEQ